ncbi:MAG TPA: hypothetical protein ENI61_00460 [Ignavibacteria bacterium]|nr:hypothetical protein [Ignavibacteria bacterium]
MFINVSIPSGYSFGENIRLIARFDTSKYVIIELEKDMYSIYNIKNQIIARYKNSIWDFFCNGQKFISSYTAAESLAISCIDLSFNKSIQLMANDDFWNDFVCEVEKFWLISNIMFNF